MKTLPPNLLKPAISLFLFAFLISTIDTFGKSLEDYSNETNAHIQNQNWPALERLMRDGIQEYPDREWLHANLNYSLREQKKFEEAVIHARRMRSKWPDTERSATTLSRALTSAASDSYQEGKYEKCLKLAREALEVDGSESSYVWTGNALRKLARYKEAVEIQEEGVSKYPTNPWLKPNLATTYAAWGQEAEEAEQFADAAHRYRRAIGLGPDQEYIQFRLGRALRSNGEFQEAIEAFEEGQKRFPDSDQFVRAVGYTHLLRIRDRIKTDSNAKIDELASNALDAAKACRKFEDCYYLITAFGEAYTHTGNGDALRKAMKSMESRLSDPVPLWDFYGRQIYILHRRQGPVQATIKDEALSYRRKAMSTYESRHSQRSVVSGLPLPLKSRFSVWAEFDGDYMTHTGFAKYCYDFSRVDDTGNYLRPGGKKLKADDYWMFGEPVYSMTSGTVSTVILDQPDNTGGSYGKQGNSVTVQLANGTFAFYTHFKQHSIKVKEGQKVTPGTLLGLAGNSGMSSEPHLHVCMYDKNWVSLPFRFKPVRVKRGDEVIETTEPLKQGWIVEGH